MIFIRSSGESHRVQRTSLAKAQHVYLTVMAGRSTTESEDAVRSIEQAVAMGEPMVAARLGGALAYGHLSRGDFGKAVTFAENSLVFGAADKKTRNCV